MNKRRVIVLILVMILSIGLAYLYFDREVIKLKRGGALPVLWSSREQFEEDPIKLTTHNEGFANPNVTITPIYYMPESHELHLGLWFKKWRYNDEYIPDRVFDVSFVDEKGQVYNQESVARQSALFDEFHFRRIEGVDLSKVKSLELVITLIEQEGRQVTPIESKKMKVPLEKIQ